MSRLSSGPVADSHWFASDFILAASLVIIQPSSAKVVIVNDTHDQTWFLPRGRKDVGESLEQCALREGFEESGYQAEFLPIYTQSIAPVGPAAPPGARHMPNTEAIFVTTTYAKPRQTERGLRTGQEYMAFYYVGQIPPDAVRQTGTGMPDEQSYVGTLVDIEEALRRLSDPTDAWVTHTAFWLWQHTLEEQEKMRKEEKRKRELEEQIRTQALVGPSSKPNRHSFFRFS
ncbi:hypothetical protein FA95DRAFT_1604701 [Auriscalpium vulgare]|uniref:Uncharacterized protein n=1 Tax=Auriscalpium vulgare TaxID=40419 RepID=A0ACB8RZI4_9AGAM|nr:hypothetical protein FA95DRAFT_1604701 [Auriscalpium vulgare]